MDKMRLLDFINLNYLFITWLRKDGIRSRVR